MTMNAVDYNKGLYYANEMLALALKTKNNYMAGEADNYTGNAYQGLGDFNKAVEYFQRAINFYAAKSSSTSKALSHLAEAHRMRGDYQNAIKYNLCC